MKTLCMTGLIQQDLDFLAQVLEQAGLKPAKPAARDAQLSIGYWHDQVLKLPLGRYTEAMTTENAFEEAPSSQEIGRLWEQLASDIFISNLASEAWGWADQRSADLLPFWKRFDPQTRFLLIAVRPERYIAHHIEHSEEVLDHRALLVRWMQFHQALIRFHRENPNISVLADFEDCVSQPGAMIKTCTTRFDLGLTPVHFPNASRDEVSEIARFLAAEICALDSVHRNLALDLQASVTPIGMHHGAFRVPTATALIAGYREIKGKLAQAAQSVNEKDAQIKEAHIQSTQIATLQTDLQRISAERDQWQTKEQQSRQESELLLTQLHQLQVQLDLAVAKEKESLDERTKHADELSKELTSWKSQHEQLLEREKNSQEESDLLLAQLHQVQEELESYFLKYEDANAKLQVQQQESQQQLSQVKSEVATGKKELDQALLKHKETVEKLTKERNTEIERANKLQGEIERGTKQSVALKNELDVLKAQQQQLLEREKDTQEENDLLLAQLHQVQEELENYFLKYQDADAKLQALESRLNRLMARYPAETMVDSIRVVDPDTALEAPASIGATPMTQWSLVGLEVGAQVYEHIQFGSFIEEGVACLTFSRDSKANREGVQEGVKEGAGVLARWPGTQDEDTVVIATVGDETTGPERARVLKDLSATDWQLVKAIVALLAKELANPSMLQLPRSMSVTDAGAVSLASKRVKKPTGATKSGFDLQAQAQAFGLLRQQLSELPPLLHFDGLRLGMLQEEPEYEFLTFSFDKCWIGDRFVPEFEFRFASVNIPAGQFGTHPRLEFHEARSKAGFQAWFEESIDDFGSKLELRFARPNAMDLNVWQRMTDKDQDMVAALIAQLPLFIEHIKTDSRSMYRSWDDWTRLAHEVHNTLLIGLQGLTAQAWDDDVSQSEEVDLIQNSHQDGEMDAGSVDVTADITAGVTAGATAGLTVHSNRKRTPADSSRSKAATQTSASAARRSARAASATTSSPSSSPPSLPPPLKSNRSSKSRQTS